MRIQCPQCSKGYNVAETHIGRTVQCKACNTRFVVGEAEQQPQPLAAAALSVPAAPPAPQYTAPAAAPAAPPAPQYTAPAAAPAAPRMQSPPAPAYTSPMPQPAFAPPMQPPLPSPAPYAAPMAPQPAPPGVLARLPIRFSILDKPDGTLMPATMRGIVSNRDRLAKSNYNGFIDIMPDAVVAAGQSSMAEASDGLMLGALAGGAMGVRGGASLGYMLGQQRGHASQVMVDPRVAQGFYDTQHARISLALPDGQWLGIWQDDRTPGAFDRLLQPLQQVMGPRLTPRTLGRRPPSSQFQKRYLLIGIGIGALIFLIFGGVMIYRVFSAVKNSPLLPPPPPPSQVIPAPKPNPAPPATRPTKGKRGGTTLMLGDRPALAFIARPTGIV